MDLHRLHALRPFAYHLTARENLPGIRGQRMLRAARLLATSDADRALLHTKRKHSVAFASVLIRDQAPLFEGNIRFPEGFGFEDLLDVLNSHVFFWPGVEAGPIDHGRRHFERYRQESIAILRAPTRDLFAANPEGVPHGCLYNSGSPRCSGGEKSPRGPDTFVPLEEMAATPSKIVELTYRDAARLPPRTEVSSSPRGPWKPL